MFKTNAGMSGDMLNKGELFLHEIKKESTRLFDAYQLSKWNFLLETMKLHNTWVKDF